MSPDAELQQGTPEHFDFVDGVPLVFCQFDGFLEVDHVRGTVRAGNQLGVQVQHGAATVSEADDGTDQAGTQEEHPPFEEGAQFGAGLVWHPACAVNGDVSQEVQFLVGQGRPAVLCWQGVRAWHRVFIGRRGRAAAG